MRTEFGSKSLIFPVSAIILYYISVRTHNQYTRDSYISDSFIDIVTYNIVYTSAPAHRVWFFIKCSQVKIYGYRY